jgi:hypothetical protein
MTFQQKNNRFEKLGLARNFFQELPFNLNAI